MTLSHKMLGILYLLSSAMVGFVGFVLSCFIRLELHISGCGLLFGDYQCYNVIITSHGLLMIFGYIMPIVLGGFTNFYAPLFCGFPDMVYPRLNNTSLWFFLGGCLIFVTGFSTEEGAGLGWTLYPTLICCDFHLGICVDFVIFSVHLLGISSILNSLNVVGTIFVSRRKYFSTLFISLFIWGILLTSFLLILCLPILAGGVTLILFDRNFNTALDFVWVGVISAILIFWGHPL